MRFKGMPPSLFESFDSFEPWNPKGFLSQPRQNLWGSPDIWATPINPIGVDIDPDELRRMREPSFRSKSEIEALRAEKLTYTEDDVIELFRKYGHHATYMGYQSLGQINQLLLESLVGNQKAESAIEEWYSATSGIKPCAVCGYEFDRVWMLSGYYFATAGQHICLGCEITDHPTGDALINAVRNVATFLDDIPFRSLEIDAYGRLWTQEPEDFIEFCKLWRAMGGLTHVKQELGSWFQALALSGVLPDGVQVTKRGIKCLAKDGHLCRSLGEKTVDDWLFDHGIEHEAEPKYPRDPEHNPNQLLRADWKVGETFIELFGMEEDPNYATGMERKRKLAAAHDIKLIELFPRNLGELDTILSGIDW